MKLRRAGGKPDELDKESDAVRADTEPASDQDAAMNSELTTENDECSTTTTQHIENTSDTDAGVESAGADPDDLMQEHDGGAVSAQTRRRFKSPALLAFIVLPCLVFFLAAAAGYMKWQEQSIRAAQISSVESVTAAKDGTIAILSYQPDTAEKDLGAAQNRLTGTFKDSYTQLIHDVVIPGAKQRHISAVATVPASATVSATASHAVTLVFVNQTVVVGNDPPSATPSTVRVTLDKVRDQWLISGFDPV
jgi:Mce-associated membrane protein